MLAFRTHRFGGKAAAEEAPSPVPGVGQVLIAVRAACVHLADAAALAGERAPRPELPFIPGFEAAGVVSKPAKGFKKGEAVLAFLSAGGLAEEVAADVALCVALPKALAPDHAAGLPIAYAGALMALRDKAGLSSGETLLVLGGGGQRGLGAVAIGKVLGARVIAVASTDERRSAATAQGADHAIDGSQTSLADSVMALTDGKGADVIFDPVGGDGFGAALSAAAVAGRYISAGFAAGRMPGGNVQAFYARGIDLLTANVPLMAQTNPARARKALEDVVAWAVAGKIRPRIAAQFPLAQANHALEYVMARRDSGAVIVTIP